MKKRSLIIICSFFFFLTSYPAIQVWGSGATLLKQGMTGSEVRVLQNQLQEYGYYQAEVDGVFGTATTSALIAFQLDNDLGADGVAGPATLKALREFRSGNVVSRAQPQSRKGVLVASFARQFLGVPYVWGGYSPAGFDCSGYIYYIFAHFGIDMPRMADGQFESGQFVSRRDLQVGDLVFFSTYEPGPSHVGIYIGNGQFIHASSGAGVVTITPLSKSYYLERFVGARRVLR